MKFMSLDLNTRFKIYSQTKKVLRKYQKGIISGKLTSTQFVENMLKDPSLVSILTESNLCVINFRDSYKEYVDTLIEIQNQSLVSHRNTYNGYYSDKAPCSSVFKLNKILLDSNYMLSIPTQYLTEWDIDCIVKYINTGEIDIGNEKIYNYVSKIK